MSAAIFQDLQWLPRPKDFAISCRKIRDSPGDRGEALRMLATYALSDAQLTRLARLIQTLRTQDCSLKPLVPYRLGVIGNGTLGLMAPALMATAARYGLLLDCTIPAYGQAVQDTLSADSPIYRERCDAVMIALDYRGLPLTPSPGAPERAQQMVDEALALVRQMRERLRASSGGLCIVQTLAPPPEALFGSLDRLVAGTLRHMVEAFNQGLCAELAESDDMLLDVASLAQTVGLADWHSPTQWNVAKLGFSLANLPLYADHVCRLIAAKCGKSRRALILDLDNTIWGGIIGDDGLNGIVLGEGDGSGEAFLSVQRMALNLRERGVVLAVSSKNTDAVARQPFQTHPDMLLREDHIAVFQANWNDKATNIKAIAGALSLGLDALVLLDDNPAERALVRQFLPEVAVPELPDDPALYARTLAAAGYFEAVSFSDEDRRRSSFYQDNALRAALGRAVGNLDDYIAALEMQATFSPFDALNRTRICQLISKSNQFNLTTRRYTEPEICRLETDPSVFTLQVRLKDRFGDNGLICVVICRGTAERQWIIDTWLMSCRVLGRGVERMVLAHLIEQARPQGICTLIGHFRPTARNDLVRDHYRKLGFAEQAPDPSGETTWHLPVATATSHITEQLSPVTVS